MSVVLDNAPGERVLLYGSDGTSLLKVLTDASGRLVVVVNSTTGTVTVTATNLDIRDLVKAQDELYAVLRDDAGSAYDARRIQGIDGSTQRQVAVDASARVKVAVPQERATLTVGKQYVASVAPHGNTSRLSYTVPASRIAVLEWVEMRLTRDAAAAPAGIALVRLVLTPTGSAGTQIGRVLHITNGVGDVQVLEIGVSMWLEAGDALEMFSQDASTGGTIDYELALVLSEFDA